MTRRRGVVLFNGPWLLLAPAETLRPVIVVPSSRDGRLVLPGAAQDGSSVATIPSLDAPDESLQAVQKSAARLPLAPWHRHPRDKNAAFVFDMIVVPEPK